MPVIKLSSKNQERASWVEAALQAFCKETRQSLVNDGNEEVVSDFLGDLRHYCELHKLDFDALNARGGRRYKEEIDTVCLKCGCHFCGFDEGSHGFCNDCLENEIP